MKSNPAVPGGQLTSKPTWRNTFGCSATSAFFVVGDEARSPPQEKNPMHESNSTTALEIAKAATEVAPTTGAAVQVFTTGTIVQVFLLNRRLPADSWSGNRPVGSIT